MASDIVFTNANNGPGTTFTLRGSESGVTVGLAWQKLEIRSRSPWSDVLYTGFSGKDVKWMGGRPNTFVIRGYVFADTESNLWLEVEKLVKQNKGQTLWNITSNPIKTAAGGGVIMDINLPDHGGDTGLKWPFKIFFTNLAVD